MISPSSPSSSEATPTSSQILGFGGSNPNSHHNPNIGAIIGGVLGGVATLSILSILLYWWCLRRRSNYRTQFVQPLSSRENSDNGNAVMSARLDITPFAENLSPSTAQPPPWSPPRAPVHPLRLYVSSSPLYHIYSFRFQLTLDIYASFIISRIPTIREPSPMHYPTSINSTRHSCPTRSRGRDIYLRSRMLQRSDSLQD